MIMQFRTYTMVPGAREEFTTFSRRRRSPRMRAAGMTVLGQFSSVTDPDVFAYARPFPASRSASAVSRVLAESEDWLGWMIDTATWARKSFLVFLGDS